MTTFWQALAQVAQGQLFNGGHLSHAAVVDLMKRADTPRKGKRNDSCRDQLPWPRLAIPH
jgi:hypothetical protein